MNFARLNHILLPDTKAGRDRFRAGIWGKALSPISWLYGALSDEGRVLLVSSLLVGFFGLDPSSTQVYILWAAIIGLLAGSLAVRPFYRLAGVTLSVVVPPRATLGEEIRFGVIVQNGGPRDVFAVRVRGPFLPWDGTWIARRPTLRHVPRGKEVLVLVGARFVARGEHHLDPFGAAALLPFGLAMGAPVSSPGVKFLVVPKIARVARLSLPLGRRHQPGGVALASKTGESKDLLGTRPYRPGDPVKNLHARSWARAGIPVVREYQEEYFSRVGVIVDTAHSSEELFEARVSLAAGVVESLTRGEALIDLLVVGGELFDLTIGRHLGFLEQALDLLALAEPSKKPPSTDALCARLAPHLSRLSCVLLIRSAQDPALSERIRGYGVECYTLIVEDRGAAAPPKSGDRVIRVDASAILRGEALSL